MPENQPRTRARRRRTALPGALRCAKLVRRWSLVGFVAARAALFAACEARTSSAACAPAAREPAPLRVEFAGCAAVYADGRCELGGEARTLTFWSPEPDRLSARSERGALPFARVESVQQGARYRVQVPHGAGEVALLRRDGARFALRVVDVALPASLARATALRARGEFAAARALLQGELALLSPAYRGRAQALLARLELSEGRPEAAIMGLQQSMEQATARGAASDAVYDATALAYVLSVRLHDYARARSVLAGVVELAARDPASRALLPHYQGVLALELGDLRSALSHFREAALRTGRLGLESHELLARQNEAMALALLGRHPEALAIQQRIIREFPDADACRALDLREQLTWLGILAQVRPNDAAWPEVNASARQAEQLVGACHDAWRRRNHGINAGLLALLADDLPGARAAVTALHALEAGQDVSLRTWELELRGRLALAERRAADALRAFAAARALSQRAGLWNSEHLAQIGSGRSFEQLGQLARAAEAYGAAERLLDKLLDGVPLGEGLGGFVHEREFGARALAALLVRMRQPARALEVARHGRARVIRSLSQASRIAAMDPATQARWQAAIAGYRAERAALERAQAESWQLPVDRLAPFQAGLAERRRALIAAFDRARSLLQTAAAPASEPAPSNPEGALAGLFPAARGALGFYARDGRVVAEQLAAGDLAQAARSFFSRQLASEPPARDRVASLRLILHGAFATLDLHALTLDGAPLIERFAVAYALDAGESSPDAQRRGALVIADPSADLPGSLREGEAAQRALGEREAELLAGGRATRARMLEALARVAVLHYAGHGQYAGVEGIESGLRLADGWLTVGDILALRSAPALVVLSSCEGARADERGGHGGLGVAEALVAAGAGAVIAATRPVPDGAAEALFRAFYASRATAPGASAAEALRQAQIQLRAAQPAADWASFRVLVP